MSAAFDFKAIKAETDLARIIGETTDLHREGRLLKGRCPFHEEKTPSFYVYPDHFHCFGCGAHGDAIDWLVHARRMTFHDAIAYIDAGGGGCVSVAPAAPSVRPEGTDSTRNQAFAQRIWAESCLPAGTLAEDYLRSRGLEIPEEPVLRFHPRCPCGEDRRPAMVALMTDPATGEPRGIHRTFLRPDGSANTAKMMLGPAGVIRLCERITNGLGLAEGIETALAVAQRIEWGPVWAAGSAGGIRSFPVLIQTTLNLFPDLDDSGAGLSAARACAIRWAESGAEALIHHPPPGKDWHDATVGDLP